MKTVLLVDDDNVFLLTIGVRLKSMGYIVHAAKDAANAITVVRKTNPDVIVLDVSLPAGDGFLVADRLKKLIVSAATPIIFVTASEKSGPRDETGCGGLPYEALRRDDIGRCHRISALSRR
jgi:CheY-like chemotaxis protein